MKVIAQVKTITKRSHLILSMVRKIYLVKKHNKIDKIYVNLHLSMKFTYLTISS